MLPGSGALLRVCVELVVLLGCAVAEFATEVVLLGSRVLCKCLLVSLDIGLIWGHTAPQLGCFGVKKNDPFGIRR